MSAHSRLGWANGPLIIVWLAPVERDPFEAVAGLSDAGFDQLLPLSPGGELEAFFATITRIALPFLSPAREWGTSRFPGPVFPFGTDQVGWDRMGLFWRDRHPDQHARAGQGGPNHAEPFRSAG